MKYLITLAFDLTIMVSKNSISLRSQDRHSRLVDLYIEVYRVQPSVKSWTNWKVLLVLPRLVVDHDIFTKNGWPWTG